jgi:CTP:molybdopterin cytidylyltransferase MocA
LSHRIARVTVAAVILYARSEGALADAAGRPAVRRAVESAWAGGATPIVVVAFDPEGAVAAALAGSPAVLAEPAPVDAGPVGQMARGIDVARTEVTDTEGALVWPGRMVWVDAETVTTLIEAYGPRRGSVLRPVYEAQAGWPVLVPVEQVDRLVALGPALMPDALIDQFFSSAPRSETIDTGDPGTVHDVSTPIDQLPAYQGPAGPVGGPAPEWGAAAAEMPDEAPLEGPSLAPYGQAADEGN